MIYKITYKHAKVSTSSKPSTEQDKIKITSSEGE